MRITCWHPLTLRWRRSRRRIEPRRPAVTVVNQTWASHSHFHLHAAGVAGHAHERQQSSPVVTPGDRTFQIIRTFHERTRTIRSLSVQTRRLSTVDNPHIRALPARACRPWPLGPNDAPDRVLRWPTNAQGPIAPESAIGQRRAPSTPTRPQQRIAQRHMVPAFEWRQTGGRWPLPIRTAAPEPRPSGDLAFATRGRGKSRGFAQPAPIVWRDAARAQRSESEGIAQRNQRPPSTNRTSPVSASPDGGAAREASALRQRTASVRLSDFEPGLVERLTDDVIRRVERRVRIERERRGL